MGPTFSSKNGVRYRFYISTALRGRKDNAGSVTRISASEIENLVEAAVLHKLKAESVTDDQPFDLVDRVTVSTGNIQITLRGAKKNKRALEIPWQPKPKTQAQIIQFASSNAGPDP
jgi:hypothetical protein